MILGLLAQEGYRFTITPPLLFSILALLVSIWLVFTIILRYHWRNYGTGGAEVFTMNFTYFIGSFSLIGLMVGSVLLYLLSSYSS